MSMKRALLAALLFLIASVGHAAAATLSLNFSLENVANGGGTVTGIVRGLADNASGAASSVGVLTNTAGFGVAAGYEVNAQFNVWTVTNGTITGFNFFSYGFTSGLTESLLLESFDPSITD